MEELAAWWFRDALAGGQGRPPSLRRDLRTLLGGVSSRRGILFRERMEFGRIGYSEKDQMMRNWRNFSASAALSGRQFPAKPPSIPGISGFRLRRERIGGDPGPVSPPKAVKRASPQSQSPHPATKIAGMGESGCRFGRQCLNSRPVPNMDQQPFADGAATNREFLRSVFQSMLRARILENKLSSLYKAGKIVGLSLIHI